MTAPADSTVDMAFVTVFQEPEPLRSLLNAVLEFPQGHQIETVEVLNPQILMESADDKLSILDIKARDQTQQFFNIEMQMVPFHGYKKRVLYYWAKLYQQQLKKGGKYSRLRPTISISFLNHVLFPEEPRFHTRYQLLETTSHRLQLPDLDIHYLELPKFRTAESKLASTLDLWLYLLRNASRMEVDNLPAFMQRTEFKQSLEILTMLTRNSPERERYEARRKAQLDINTMRGEAFEEGLEKGMEKARREEKASMIRTFQQLLNLTLTSPEQLSNLSLDDLTQLETALRLKLLVHS